MVKEQIQQLVSDAIDKYEKDTGEKVIRNQNPDNYKGLAIKLSEISNKLPIDYPKDFEPDTGGRYDITTAQIRDALFGKVEKIKVHFNEALHLYIYGKRSAEVSSIKSQGHGLSADPGNQKELIRQKAVFRRRYAILIAISAILFIAFLFLLFKWLSVKHQYENTESQLDSTKHQFDSIKKHFETIKGDMRIVPHIPTNAEIESLQGVYLVYTGSPQVRKSDTDRYHKAVPNILDVSYKGGYFTFDRYGPDFSQKGYMQFEDSNLVSMYSYVIDTSVKQSPKKTLMQLGNGKNTFNVISASWTFDSSIRYNVIIGIREVFIKIGKPGSIIKVKKENVGFDGTTVYLKKDNGGDTIIRLKNVLLETLPKSIQPLLDEKSIIAKDLDDSLLLKKPATK